MPTPSTRLGLLVPTTTDKFSTADLASNWQKLDAAPGIHLCTSTTRPTWGSGQFGRVILELDTGLHWWWVGGTVGWARLQSQGILHTTTGGWARAQRFTDFSTASFTYVVVVAIQNVVVPAGNRPLMLVIKWFKGENSIGAFRGSVIRSSSNNGTPLIEEIALSGDSTSPTAGAGGQGGTFVCFEPGGLAAGTYSYSFQIRSVIGGTSYIRASATSPAEIAVIEL